MAAARKIDESHVKAGVVRPALEEASGNSEPVLSPALALQSTLEQAYKADLPEPYVKKWPPALRLALLGQLTVSSWAAVLFLARLLVK